MTRNELLATAGETVAYAEDYIETRIRLAKLELAERSTVAAAAASAGAIVGGLSAVGALFLSVALALWIGSLGGSYALGFVVVGLVYLLVAVAVYLFRRPLLTRPLMQQILRRLFPERTHAN